MSKKRKRRKVNRVCENEAPRKPRTDIHHFYWPKKLYKQNTLLELDYDLHHGYHSHFYRHCATAINRKCWHVKCIYWDICCYRGTTIQYGNRVT